MQTVTHTTVFDRVVCGVDRSDPGVSAARAAGVVTSPDGSLTLLAVDDPSIAVHAGWAMPQVLADLAEEAQAALERGRVEAEPLHALEAKLVEGDPRSCCSPRSGAAGQPSWRSEATGSPAPRGLRSARFPRTSSRSSLRRTGRARVDRDRSLATTHRRRLDGSPDSERALHAALALASRFDREVRVITATQDARSIWTRPEVAPDLEEHDARALDALNVAAETTDLVVVGGRGLRGLKALGSLSERLAHEAEHSVLSYVRKAIRRPDMSASARAADRRAVVTRFSRHYLPDLVYGANDGIITTFAVVFGVSARPSPSG